MEKEIEKFCHTFEHVPDDSVPCTIATMIQADGQASVLLLECPLRSRPPKPIRPRITSSLFVIQCNELTSI